MSWQGISVCFGISTDHRQQLEIGPLANTEMSEVCIVSEILQANPDAGERYVFKEAFDHTASEYNIDV